MNNDEKNMLDRVVAAVASNAAKQQEESEKEIAQFNELMKAAATINLPDRAANNSRFNENEYAPINLSPHDLELAESVGNTLAAIMDSKRNK